jgi:pantothenate kinase
MADIAHLAELLRDKAQGHQRFMVAIAGAPGAGKSTLSSALKAALEAGGETAVVVPMDGFHFDDIVLNARGHRSRKGAPYTYDAAGFKVLLQRIRAREPDVAIPVFDRTMELSRAAAEIISADTRFILIEGNYLLLDEAPWQDLRPFFDFTIFLNVPVSELQRRLEDRWLALGFDMAYANNWISSNDMPNIGHVIRHSAAADLAL